MYYVIDKFESNTKNITILDKFRLLRLVNFIGIDSHYHYQFKSYYNK